jgi:hypothetical protein
MRRSVVRAYQHSDPTEDVEGDESLPRGGQRRPRGNGDLAAQAQRCGGVQRQRILEEEEETRARMILKGTGGARAQ